MAKTKPEKNRGGSGKFKPGQSGNPAGRPPGPNKTTLAVREAIAKLADGHAEKFIGWVDKVAETDPKGAADLYLKAIEYHIPKLARQEHTGEGGGPVYVYSRDKHDDAI